MPRYRNEGPAWRRSSGEEVARNEVFTATEREHARIQRRQQTDRFVLLKGEAASTAPPSATTTAETPEPPKVEAPTPAAAEEEKTADTPTEVKVDEEEVVEEKVTEEELPEWPMKTPPEQYVARYPTGEHVDLAKRIMARNQ